MWRAAVTGCKAQASSYQRLRIGAGAAGADEAAGADGADGADGGSTGATGSSIFGSGPIEMAAVNDTPMWYRSAPSLPTDATEHRATRPSTTRGVKVPSKVIVSRDPGWMRTVHSASRPLDEMFTSEASAPCGEMRKLLIERMEAAGMRGAARFSVLASAAPRWLAAAPGAGESDDLDTITTGLPPCAPWSGPVGG